MEEGKLPFSILFKVVILIDNSIRRYCRFQKSSGSLMVVLKTQ
jgi:hypothetical protein